ncbi:MAG: hypothetical protein H0W88_10840 [Parachlamydiaceae bacterium]|nr:hypothetical protein [Parachlamydiaceae bacterium]
MSNNITHVLNEIKTHFYQYKIISVLGLAIVGLSLYQYGGRSLKWIYKCFAKTEKVNDLALKQLKTTTEPQKTKKTETNSPLVSQTKSTSVSSLQEVLEKTPKFNGYKITLPEKHPCKGVVLTGINIRPANLFFSALFHGTDISTTMPGSGSLFKFNVPQNKIREFLQLITERMPESVVHFSAKGFKGRAMINGSQEVSDLGDIFGNNTYRISHSEIQEIHESQKIFITNLLSREFYNGLKVAMHADKIVVLPGNDSNPMLVSELLPKTNAPPQYPAATAFLAQVNSDPIKFGFKSRESYEQYLQMTLYQIGSMVVKIEDYRVFIDGDGKIIERKVGTKDQIRLISACGIRGLHSTKTDPKFNNSIMSETFKTALKAANDGIVVFPAVGMGVWRGDPDLYWRAFLNAIITRSDDLELIYVNPRHQPSASGKYVNFIGNEFQIILDEYKSKYIDNENISKNLDKIKNLFDSQKDVVQLARELKLAYPDKTISLFNASDPDVTLGFHVGEYVNNCPHCGTTEENLAAAGTSLLGFEHITGVHENPDRIIQT